jgi:transposase
MIGFVQYVEYLKKILNHNNINFFFLIFLYQISRWFPSSKTCGVCGTKLKQLKLSNHVFACPNRDSVMDRDFNTTLNIVRQGPLELKLSSI